MNELFGRLKNEKNPLNQTTKNAKIKWTEREYLLATTKSRKITQPIEFARMYIVCVRRIHFVAKKSESLCVDISQLREIGLGLARR